MCPVLTELPKLIVFDLDFTLWDCGGTWCDCLSPPFTTKASRIFDRGGRQIKLYDEVLAILDHCDSYGVPMALASRTEQPPWARRLIELLGIACRFAHMEIYPSTKIKHFSALRLASRSEYADMLFFDDEMRNIHEVGSLGVTSIYVEDGLTLKVFQDSLRDHANRRSENS